MSGKEKKHKEKSVKNAKLAAAQERAKTMLSHPRYATSDDSLVLKLQMELAELKKKVESQSSLEDSEYYIILALLYITTLLYMFTTC